MRRRVIASITPRWLKPCVSSAALAVVCLLASTASPPAIAVRSTGAGGTVVSTDAGAVRGETQDKVLVFRGIPFAAPPVGALRFHPPAPPAHWTGVRATLDFAPACPQTVATDVTENNNSLMAEDCLAVNVWTPKADQAKRPVMVFIHGGAFIEGSARNTGYDGSSLAGRGDVVVVTLQYRVGALGFLELADIAGKAYAQSGNLGILDQIAALQWVRRNIASFGGDPGNVTIFGESVGATSVGILMATPAGWQGLFHKAILESNSAARVGHDRASATALARAFLHAAGANTVEDLQALSMREILAAQERLFASVFGDSSFGPTWDAEVVPESPLKAIMAGRGARVPVLLGTNLDEIRFWSEVEGLPLERKPEGLLEKQLTAIVGPRAKALVATYRKAFPDYGDAVIHIETDLLFRMTSIRMSESISHLQPTWMYLFTYRSTSPVVPAGAAHSMELPFVFGTIDELDQIAFTGRHPRRAALMAQMQDAWLAFAKGGNPAHDGLPPWPRYDPQTRSTMAFGTESRVVEDPYGEQRSAWDGVPFDGVRPSPREASVFLSENGQ